MVKTRVFLWSPPRCVATAIERSIRTLKNGKVFHEPFLTVFYYSPERRSQRPACESSLQAFSETSYQSVSELLQKEYDGKEFVFIKDMAHCVKDKFDIFLAEGYKDFKHTFIIRHPKKALRSLYKLSTNPELTGWDYFDPVEAGFQQLFELYEFIEKHIQKDPVVVDADDLLRYPDEIMKRFCEAVGLKYEEAMTSWAPGPISDWGPCTAWHDQTVNSSGFDQTNEPDCDEGYLTPEVAEVVKQCMPYYEAMRAKRIVPKAESNLED